MEVFALRRASSAPGDHLAYYLSRGQDLVDLARRLSGEGH